MSLLKEIFNKLKHTLIKLLEVFKNKFFKKETKSEANKTDPVATEKTEVEEYNNADKNEYEFIDENTKVDSSSA